MLCFELESQSNELDPNLCWKKVLEKKLTEGKNVTFGSNSFVDMSGIK
jgi:hypothetical protein